MPEASHNLSLNSEKKAHAEVAVEETDNSIPQVPTVTAGLMDLTEVLIDFATVTGNKKAGEDMAAEGEIDSITAVTRTSTTKYITQVMEYQNDSAEGITLLAAQIDQKYESNEGVEGHLNDGGDFHEIGTGATYVHTTNTSPSESNNGISSSEGEDGISTHLSTISIDKENRKFATDIPNDRDNQKYESNPPLGCW